MKIPSAGMMSPTERTTMSPTLTWAEGMEMDWSLRITEEEESSLENWMSLMNFDCLNQSLQAETMTTAKTAMMMAMPSMRLATLPPVAIL